MFATPQAEHDLVTASERWPSYRVYGLTFASNFLFKSRLFQDAAPPQLTFTCRQESSRPDLQSGDDLIYASPFQLENGESNFYLYRIPQGYLLRFTDVADFDVRPNRVECRMVHSNRHHVVENLFLGFVLSLILELKEITALHAAAVVLRNGAVAFLADNKGGKSSLAAGLMVKGYELLSDDILPVRCGAEACLADPGYPQMRLWPSQAEHFLGHYETLDLVDPDLSKRRIPVGPGDFGRFYDRPAPLRCVYLPSRRIGTEAAADIEIRSVPQSEALMELVRHSFIPRTVDAMDLQPQRLRRFATMLKHVRIRRLVYPSGFEHVPRVCAAILEDVDELSD